MIRKKNTKKIHYNLLENAFSNEDLNKAIKVLKSKQITMSKETLRFERNFAKYVGSKYACMVNSGSSANLLSVFASCNPLRKNRFKPGDEAIIQGLCWSTSLWPLVQAGLKPVFVDVDPNTFNVRTEDIINSINKNTKVILIVHVLGNSGEIDKIRKICKKRKIILIEDACESLGSKYKNKFLGTFGDFGTYSFYYSHQITSGEGGMIVCNNFSDYQILVSMRAHGWSRGIKLNNELSRKYKNIDKRFLFLNSGFNLRPLDLTATIGNNQLKRINKFITIRNYNREKIIKKLTSSKCWNNQFTFLKASNHLKPSWFGLPILLHEKFSIVKAKFLKYLEKNNIENRPIISGNFLNQPSIKLFKLNNKRKKLKGAQSIEDRGFFIGIHTKKISNDELNHLEKKLLNIENL
jgi:CDP-4-dehydro-6-deoxyglucose reductase, E1